MTTSPSPLFLSLLAAPLCLSACGGAHIHEPLPDSGLADAHVDAGPESDQGGPIDAGVDAGLEDAEVPPDQGVASLCGAPGALRIPGDYIDGAGHEHWLRVGAHAVTYAVVPADPAVAPELSLVLETCSDLDRVVLRASDGTMAALDYRAVHGGGLRACVRSVGDLAAARELPPPAFADASTGCAGMPFMALAPGGV